MTPCGLEVSFSCPSPLSTVGPEFSGPRVAPLARGSLAALDEVADPDAILLTWHMPKVSGVDLLLALSWARQLVHLPQFEEHKVVFSRI